MVLVDRIQRSSIVQAIIVLPIARLVEHMAAGVRLAKAVARAGVRRHRRATGYAVAGCAEKRRVTRGRVHAEVGRTIAQREEIE